MCRHWARTEDCHRGRRRRRRRSRIHVRRRRTCVCRLMRPVVLTDAASPRDRDNDDVASYPVGRYDNSGAAQAAGLIKRVPPPPFLPQEHCPLRPYV